MRPVETVAAYLETVHLVADDALWIRLRADLMTLLDGGAAAEIAAWLTEHRVVFPGCEDGGGSRNCCHSSAVVAKLRLPSTLSSRSVRFPPSRHAEPNGR